MSTVDLTGLVWRKSSRSGGGSGGNCVEVVFAGLAVAVRDSKNTEAGALVIPAAHWRMFLAAL